MTQVVTADKTERRPEVAASILPKNLFKLLTAVSSACALCVAAPSLFSQTVSTGSDRAQITQQETQPLTGAGLAPDGFVDGHAVETPNDPDIGQQELIGAQMRYEPFTFSIATPVFYTSNVALTPHNQKGDVVFAPLVAASFDPRLTSTLYGHIGAREQVFYYGKHDDFDFASLDCQAGLTYFLPQFHNVVLRAWYDFNRLTLDDRLGDEFFSDHDIILNAEIPFRFGRAQQIAVGADATLSVGADHQFPRRNDYEEYIGYSVALTQALSFQAVGRFVARHYHQNDRNDVSEIVQASATYRVTNWCSLSAISSFAHNDSNREGFDYDVGNIGGAVEVTVKF